MLDLERLERGHSESDYQLRDPVPSHEKVDYESKSVQGKREAWFYQLKEEGNLPKGSSQPLLQDTRSQIVENGIETPLVSS